MWISFCQFIQKPFSFQKIQKLDYTFQEGFNEEAKDLIRRLLVIEPRERLGARDNVYYTRYDKVCCLYICLGKSLTVFTF